MSHVFLRLHKSGNSSEKRSNSIPLFWRKQGEMVIPLSVVASGGSLIDLDASYFIQLPIFLVVFILLRQLLFKPVIKLIEARREATEGTLDVAHKLDEDATHLAEEIDSQLTEVSNTARTERGRILDEARREEREILAKAREEARDLVEKSKAEMTEQAERARLSLREEVSSLAEAVTAKILGREVSP